MFLPVSVQLSHIFPFPGFVGRPAAAQQRDNKVPVPVGQLRDITVSRSSGKPGLACHRFLRHLQEGIMISAGVCMLSVLVRKGMASSAGYR